MYIRKTFLAPLAPIAFFVPAAIHAGLPYGPETCLQGHVWRDAVANDHVCVTPDARAQAASDNAQASTRVQPGGGAYGPNTCLSGYVWREAQAGDVVCVTPEVRARTAEQNANADSHRAQTVCSRYARSAVNAFRQAASRPGCGIGDARWHADYQAHFEWCTTAQPDWLQAEDGARAQHLADCGKQVMIDQGPELVPADD